MALVRFFRLGFKTSVPAQAAPSWFALNMALLRRIIRVTALAASGIFACFVAVVLAAAFSQNYAIGKEEAIVSGDAIQNVEDKKGLLKSSVIDVSEVNPAYHQEGWLSVVEHQGGSIRSYYMPYINAIMPSGFVVVFDAEGRVFLIIPTDT